jgi:hypothetical protein
MPKGAKVLSFQVQTGGFVLWAEVDPGEPIEGRWFCMRGTGRLIYNYTGVYIGTAQLGGFVAHLYEIKRDFGEEEKNV